MSACRTRGPGELLQHYGTDEQAHIRAASGAWSGRSLAFRHPGPAPKRVPMRVRDSDTGIVCMATVASRCWDVSTEQIAKITLVPIATVLGLEQV